MKSSTLSLVKTTPRSIPIIKLEQRGVCLVVSNKTIARMYVDLDTGCVRFEDVDADVVLTEHSISFKNLPAGTVKIGF